MSNAGESSAKGHKNVTNFDWRSKGKLSPVEHQGKANSCFAFATCGIIEALYRIQNEGKDVTLSRQDIFNQLIKIQEDPEKGSSVPETLRWIIENGCILAEQCPYEGKFNPMDYVREPCMWIETYKGFDLAMEMSVKQKKKMEKDIEYEIQIAPVAAEMLWLPDMKHVKREIYSGPKHADDFIKAEGHGVNIVGFGEEKKEKKLIRFWVIQNSHGTSWGENGFGRIDRSPSHGRLLIHKVWVVRGVTTDKKREEESRNM